MWECGGILFAWFGEAPQMDEFGIHKISRISSFIIINLASAVFVVLLFVLYKQLKFPRKIKAKSCTTNPDHRINGITKSNGAVSRHQPRSSTKIISHPTTTVVV